MQIFFSSFSAIESFTHSLKLASPDNACQHCGQNSQWVSHGKVKKQTYSHNPKLVGKRIFCSNRNNKTGCGRTRQLYVAEVIPRKHYTTIHLIDFIAQLLAGHWVEDAYRKIAGECDARQAWRWLNQLHAKLGEYRALIKQPLSHFPTDSFPRSTRLQLLLTTFKQFFKEGFELSNLQLSNQLAVF